MKRKNKIPARYKIFVKAYLVSKNKTDAAIKAGYSPKTARQQGNRLCTIVYIRDEIAKGLKGIEEKLQIEAEDIAKELKNHAYFDLSEVMTINKDVIEFKDINALPPEIRRCIQSVEITDKGAMRVKFVDKQGALRLLGQYKGMFIEKVQHSGEVRTLMDLVKHAAKK